MNRYFNTTGFCSPQEHYMVNLDSRLTEIRKYVDAGRYFIINRGRQYGKTTLLKAIEQTFSGERIVVSLDFQGLSSADYKSEEMFVKAFARELWRSPRLRSSMDDDTQSEIKRLKTSGDMVLGDLFVCLSDWCDETDKPILLLIDEIDSASDNQVFLDFLSQLRKYYLNRDESATFQSVILSGVRDVRNLRQRIRPDSEHRHNSPWNIAAKFDVDMSFSPDDIQAMLSDYENDHDTGMELAGLAQLIYDYTSGYPVLVSAICKLLDEEIRDWSCDGVLRAVNTILNEKSPLFESLVNKLEDNAELKSLIYRILMQGESFLYNPDNAAISEAFMFGFLTNDNGCVRMANRLFETRLYNWFLTEQVTAVSGDWQFDRNQFIRNGRLDMELVLEKFVLHFHDLFAESTERFLEEDGRRYFLLYLRPIINGIGNYYVEAQTRNRRRTDIIVDYLGEQFVIETKIWRGDEYNQRGERQLSEYLDYYHLDKGYMLSFCFNKSKEVGIHEIKLGDKSIIEAVG